MDNKTLISDNIEDLLSTAKLLAVHQGKPFYIAQTQSKMYKITSIIPHTPAWKRDKLEWIRTVMPIEK